MCTWVCLGVCHACVIIVDEPDGTSHTERTCINGVGAFNGKTLRTVEGHDGNIGMVEIS